VERTLPGSAPVLKTVGLPGFQRSPVKGYRIRRIITDSSGKSLVFLIEKIQHDRNGDSTRYMVETVRF
jgi:predicted secreted protein